MILQLARFKIQLKLYGHIIADLENLRRDIFNHKTSNLPFPGFRTSTSTPMTALILFRLAVKSLSMARFARKSML